MRDPTVEIDAVDRFEEAMDEMLARLLAVGDDVDPGILLQLQGNAASRRAWPRRAPRPSSRQGAHSICGSASQDGFGRLPAIVVSSTPAPRNRLMSRLC